MLDFQMECTVLGIKPTHCSVYYTCFIFILQIRVVSTVNGLQGTEINRTGKRDTVAATMS